MTKKVFFITWMLLVASVAISIPSGNGADERSTPVTVMNDFSSPLPVTFENPEVFSTDVTKGVPSSIKVFGRIDGIPGESLDEFHKDWIDAIGFSGGVEQPTSTATAGGGTVERADFMKVVIVKPFDKATPKLYFSCASGDHISEIVIEFVKAGGDTEAPFFKIKLMDVLVSSVRPVISPSIGYLTEQVSFVYGKIEWTYKEMDPKTGQHIGDVVTHWNLETNTPE